MLRLTLSLLLVGAMASGCANTVGDPEDIISGDLAGRVMRGVLMASTLSTELAWNTGEPPGTTGCPAAAEDGDDLVLDYATGCTPESGITPDTVGGVVRLTVAGGMGVFVGDVQAFGFDDLPLTGEVSGDVSRAGDLLGADVDWVGLSWAEDGEDNTIEALIEIEGDEDGFLLNATSGRFLRGQNVEIDFDLEDASVARGSMGTCFVPDGGSLSLVRLGGRARRRRRGPAPPTLEFTPDAASSGDVRASFNERDPETISPCP